MTKTQRRALASLFISGPALAAHHSMDWWTVIWVLAVMGGQYLLTKD